MKSYFPMGSRKPIHHEFVFDPVEYEMIRTKKKRFIFRKNDRNYREGDTVTIREATEKGATGRMLATSITLVEKEDSNMRDGWCIISLGAIIERRK